MSFIKGILKLSEVMFILDEKNTYIASSCVIVWIVSSLLPYFYVEGTTPIPQNITILEDRALREAIKIKWGY